MTPTSSDPESFTADDFDDRVDDAWRRFRIELGDRLALHQHGDELILRLGVDPDDAPTMTFGVTGARRHRCRLSPGRTGHPDNLQVLCRRGWRELRSGDLLTEAGRRRVDEVASAAVAALRDVFDVVHPDFLIEEGDTADGAPPMEPTLEIAVAPRTAGELRGLVVESLSSLTGLPIAVDADGDIALPTRPIRTWLHTLPDVAAMECRAVLTEQIAELPAARFIATNSGRWPAVTFRLENGRLHASLRIECSVFHPANLTSALSMWFAFIADVVVDVESDCAGWVQPVDGPFDPVGMPAGLDAILELLRDGGHADGVTLAAMSGNDLTTVITHVKYCAREARTCTEQAEQSDGHPEPGRRERFIAAHDEWLRVIRELGSALSVIQQRRKRMGQGARKPHAR